MRLWSKKKIIDGMFEILAGGLEMCSSNNKMFMQ